MNQSDILAKLKAFPYDPKEYWVIAGAAMVLYGLREETEDIDLGCTKRLADRLEEDGIPCRLAQDGKRRFQVGGDVEIFEEWLCGTVVPVEGFPVISTAGLLEMKQQLGREKDRKDIERILKRREQMKKEIRGDRIILREQRVEDAAFFAHWFNQPRVMFQCAFTEPTDEAHERDMITKNHRTDDSVWYTITDLNGNIIGETGLLRMWPAWRCTDLSIIIPDPQMQRRGFGTEAIRMMLDLAFHEYGMNRVAIGVVGLNENALAFYRRIGFRQEGIEEQGYYYNGEYSDFVMMRILRSEWK